MKISVTKNDIQCAIRGALFFCPIARAINRTLGADSDAAVTSSLISFTFRGKYQEVWLPENATAFIAAFDAGQNPEPFEFDIAVGD